MTHISISLYMSVTFSLLRRRTFTQVSDLCTLFNLSTHTPTTRAHTHTHTHTHKIATPHKHVSVRSPGVCVCIGVCVASHQPHTNTQSVCVCVCVWRLTSSPLYCFRQCRRRLVLASQNEVISKSSLFLWRGTQMHKTNTNKRM